MSGCAILEHIYRWVCLGVTVQSTLTGRFVFLEYFYEWVWVGMTV